MMFHRFLWLVQAIIFAYQVFIYLRVGKVKLIFGREYKRSESNVFWGVLAICAVLVAANVYFLISD